jgi:hypothetical protein
MLQELPKFWRNIPSKYLRGGSMKKGLLITLSCLLFLVLAVPVIHASTPEESSVLKQGVSGEDVIKLQQKLREFGYYNGELDGNFGQETTFAIIDFQLDAGLEADGVAGPDTLKALKSMKSGVMVASRAQSDKRKAQQLVALAKQYIGVPYVWAGRSPSGFDCSGYIYYLFEQFGIQMPRMADGQFEAGLPVRRSDLQPGDLVFFSTYEPGPSHVGIYIGSGLFIHASSGAGEVTLTPLAKPFYQERYIGARRVLR